MTSDPRPDFKRVNDALFLMRDCDRPDVDILFFHGVAEEDYGEMYKETWMTGSGDLFWPAEWLPQQKELSRARIFSVRYDSSAKKRRDRGRFTRRTLPENLAANLIDLESGSIGQRGIPVILVGHDLGGLVIKEICLYLEKEISTDKVTMVKRDYFLRSLAGIFYFATPHQGLVLVTDRKLDGGLLPSLEILDADTAKSNNEFRMLRQSRKWMARGVGSACENPKVFCDVREASMRYDTDEFMMVLESIESITRPKSPESSSFQFFVQSMQKFITAFHERELRSEDNDPFEGTVGLEKEVKQIILDLSRQQEENAGTSAVVLHGMGGIGKSTLGTALYKTLGMRGVFHERSRCRLDKKITGREPRSVEKLQSDLLKCFWYSCPRSSSNKKKLLMKCYSEKKRSRMPLLIFLDNVEEEDELKELLPDDIGKDLPQGSHVIVATRNDKLDCRLRDMGLPEALLHEMQELDAWTSRRLFCRHAFGNGEGRVPVNFSREMVEKLTEACGGLPLALEVVGSSLQFEKDSRHWEGAIDALKKGIPIKDIQEDRLQKCLEFSYNNLSKKLQLTFLDIVFCFNGSPWNELLSMYGLDLDTLKQRALIKEGTGEVAGETYQYVKVHSLLESLCLEKGTMSRTHFIKQIKGSNIDLHDIRPHQDGEIALVLEGPGQSPVDTLTIAPKLTMVDRIFLAIFRLLSIFWSYLVSVWKLLASRYDLHGPTNMTDMIPEFILPDQHAVEARSLSISHLTRISPSLRILILKDLLVQGTFAEDELPRGLQCLVCVNSTVPFSTSFVKLGKLNFVDFSNTVDRNVAYEFGMGVKRLRLENPPIQTLKFEAGVCELKELALVKTGKNFQRVYCPKSRFSSLRKLVIEDAPSLEELPGWVYTVSSLKSLSIQRCDQVTELSNHLGDLKMLRHLHFGLKHLRRVPDSLLNLTSLKSLFLENCFSLDQLPNIGCIPTLEVVGIHMKGCSNPPSVLLGLNSPFRVTFQREISETTQSADKWVVRSRNNVDGTAKLIQEATTARQMPSLMFKPTKERLSDYVYALLPEDHPEAVVVFFHGLLVDQSEKKHAFWSTWKKKGNNDCWPITLLPEYLEDIASEEGSDPCRIRVLAVSYEGSSSVLDLQIKSTDEYLLTENFINDLVLTGVCRRRGAGEAGDVPIFLVGHDLGGILIKHFIMAVEREAGVAEEGSTRKEKLERFLLNLKVVMFYATPHSGSQAIEEKAKAISEDTRNGMLKLMSVLGAEMSRLNSEFTGYRARKGSFHTCAVVPVYKTNQKGFQGVMVVEEGSARNDVDEFHTVYADHFEACQPEGLSSNNMAKLGAKIHEEVSKIREVETLLEKNRNSQHNQGHREVRLRQGIPELGDPHI